MKVLLINYEYPPIGGGAGNATYFMARALRDMGCRVSVLTSAFEEHRGRIEEDGITLHRLFVMRRKAGSAALHEMIAFMGRSVLSAPRIAREHAVEGCIAFFSIPGGPAALALRKLQGVPYIVSVRGGDVPGHALRATRMHDMVRPLRRAVLANAAAIVANSRSLADMAESKDPFPVVDIPNGVDCERFHPAKDERGGSDDFVLLFVGRLHEEKNVAFTIEGVARVLKETPLPLRFEIVGDGPQQEELKGLVAEFGLRDRVTFHGWLGKDEIPGFYRRADALINPSLYEGSPNVVLEAMATGLPVVASDIPGNVPLVEPGRTGHVFPLENSEKFDRVIRELVADRSRSREMGRLGREIAETHYSWKSAARQYLDIFAEASATDSKRSAAR